MSIFHLSIQIVKRSSGRDAVAAAAYRAGQKLDDEQYGLVQDFTHKGVVFQEILLPQNAPARLKDRETLWNEVERIEKRKDAQLAREINIAFPKEMSIDEMKECARSYIQETFVDEGMIADWAIHNGEPEQPNPHFHVLLTLRGFTEKGEWDKKTRSEYKLDENGEKIPIIDPETGEQKVRIRKGKGVEKLWVRINHPANDWGEHSKTEEWRASWAEHANRYLDQNNQLDHRSYSRQGIDRTPMIHEGFTARKMEKNGKISERCEINREIRFVNAIKDLYKTIHRKVRDLNERFKRIKNNYRKLRSRIQRNLLDVGGSDSHSRKATRRNRVFEVTDTLSSISRQSDCSKGCDLDERIKKLKDRRINSDFGTATGRNRKPTYLRTTGRSNENPRTEISNKRTSSQDHERFKRNRNTQREHPSIERMRAETARSQTIEAGIRRHKGRHL